MAEEREKTKASLRAWWSAFTKGKGKDKKPAATDDNRVFGKPLRKSLKYASVAISMAGDDGKQYVWGYVPVIVAKVGLYLKENAVDTEGVFRIAGSQKRMRELQETFDTGPRYGKDVDWTKYSVHDAASVLRRYLNQMPEPIIPLHLYNEFRNIMVKKPFDVNAAIKTYRTLITSSPPANQYLLLYVLDLLAVFARASETNLMPASNLAVIFQPGMFSHPSHLNSADEHKIAVQVLEFLIEHQDHFVLGLSHPPPANVNPADLTVVSQPVPPEEVYFEPSDSDEDFGVLEAHEGGGGAIARKASTAQKARPATGSNSGRRKMFAGRSKAGRGSVEMQPTMSAQSASERDKLQNQVIGQRNLAPLGLTTSRSSQQGRASTSMAPSSEVSAIPIAPMETTESTVGAKIKRSKTTPTRRSAGSSKRHSLGKNTAESGSSRRRSEESGKVSAAASPNTALNPINATSLDAASPRASAHSEVPVSSKADADGDAKDHTKEALPVTKESSEAAPSDKATEDTAATSNPEDAPVDQEKSFDRNP